MQYIIVNYHYIRAQRASGFSPCTIETFEQQLAYAGRRYEIVSLFELAAAARDKTPGNFCAFTFDDGMREHYEVVLPRLERAGVTGAFFPMGLVLREQRVPLVHKLHVLLARFGAQAMVSLFHDFFPDRSRIDAITRLNTQRRFDDILTANLKETLICLPIAERAAFLDHALQNHEQDETGLAHELFMKPGEIQELARRGMEIGGHGYAHFSYETLDADLQRKDIGLGHACLCELLAHPPVLFSYPHGRYTNDTFPILEGLGYQYAVGLGGRAVSSEDAPLLLPRLDTNDFSADADVLDADVLGGSFHKI